MMTNVYLGNISTRLGNEQITLAAIAKRFNRDLGRAKDSTGVEHVCYFDENQDLLQTSAECLAESSGDTVLDGVFAAQCTPSSEFVLPTYASQVSHLLNTRGLAHTVNYGCAGIAYAISAARNQVIVDSLSGKKTSYGVIAGDHISHTLKDEWDTRALFSDAICSFIISSAPLEYELSSAAVTQVTGPNPRSMNIKAINNRFEMNGRETYRFVRNNVFETFVSLSPDLSSKSFVIPHAASKKSIDALIAKNNIGCTFYKDGMRTGNKQVSSTIFGLNEVPSTYDDIYLMPFGAELAVGSVQLKRRN